MIVGDLIIGEHYGFKGNETSLVYTGKEGLWHQFERLNARGRVYCELLEDGLHLLETRD